MELVSPNDSVKGIPALPNDDDEPKEGIHSNHMKKELGLLEGCAIILGIIFGSGIFISPKVNFQFSLSLACQFINKICAFSSQTGCHSGGQRARNVVSDLDIVWIAVNDRSTLLC